MSLKASIDKLDPKRFKRQEEAFTNWKTKTNARGTILATTGSGKTYIAFLAIDALNKAGEHRTLIVVPTKVLKEQWEELLKKHKLKNWEVSVINTIARLEESRKVDLLIVDEVHKALSEQFIKIYEKVESKWVMNLTATLPLEKKKLLLVRFPIADVIEIEEALEEEYVSEFVIYNLAIEIPSKEIIILDEWQEKYNDGIDVFRDYDGYRRFLSNPGKLQEEFSQDTGYTLTELFSKARAVTQVVNDRKHFFYGHPLKLEAIQEIRRHLPNKTAVVFSESIEFMKQVKDLKSVMYHSKMTTKQREKSVEIIRDRNSDINCIIAGKAVEAGLDIPGLAIGINTSYTSSETSFRQKLGRCIRFQKKGEIASFVNLYLKRPDGIETTEYKNWLKPSFAGREQYCRNITNVKEIEK